MWTQAHAQFGAQYTSSFVLKIFFIYDLRWVLKNIAQMLYWKYLFLFLLHLESYYSSMKTNPNALWESDTNGMDPHLPCISKPLVKTQTFLIELNELSISSSFVFSFLFSPTVKSQIPKLTKIIFDEY